MNQLPCGQCKHYDPILGPGERETRRGWCVMRSLYPHQEGPGQVFPPHAQRVGPAEAAKPYIVKKDYIHPVCPHAKQTKSDPVADKKKQQVAKTTDRRGKRVHH